MSLLKVTTSLSSSVDSVGNENTPINHQDQNKNPQEWYFREKYARAVSDYIPEEKRGEENGEGTLEEETVREQDIGNFSNPIYKGEGFRASTFDDSECGEPARSQRIRIDFTPIEGLDDNEFTVSKCCDFWTFLENHAEIKGLRALPVVHENKEFKPLPKMTSMSNNDEPTAINWLKHDGLMSKAFATKHRERYCGGAAGDNCTNWSSQKSVARRSHARSLKAAQRSISKKEMEPTNSAEQTTTEEVKTLCKQLEHWDLEHQKSMEGPRQTPTLSHAVMQTHQY